MTREILYHSILRFLQVLWQMLDEFRQILHAFRIVRGNTLFSNVAENKIIIPQARKCVIQSEQLECLTQCQKLYDIPKNWLVFFGNVSFSFSRRSHFIFFKLRNSVDFRRKLTNRIPAWIVECREASEVEPIWRAS